MQSILHKALCTLQVQSILPPPRPRYKDSNKTVHKVSNWKLALCLSFKRGTNHWLLSTSIIRSLKCTPTLQPQKIKIKCEREKLPPSPPGSPNWGEGNNEQEKGSDVWRKSKNQWGGGGGGRKKICRFPRRRKMLRSDT